MRVREAMDRDGCASGEVTGADMFRGLRIRLALLHDRTAWTMLGTRQ